VSFGFRHRRRSLLGLSVPSSLGEVSDRISRGFSRSLGHPDPVPTWELLAQLAWQQHAKTGPVNPQKPVSGKPSVTEKFVDEVATLTPEPKARHTSRQGNVPKAEVPQELRKGLSIGADVFDVTRDGDFTEAKLLKAAQALGYSVTIERARKKVYDLQNWTPRVYTTYTLSDAQTGSPKFKIDTIQTIALREPVNRSRDSGPRNQVALQDRGAYFIEDFDQKLTLKRSGDWGPVTLSDRSGTERVEYVLDMNTDQVSKTTYAPPELKERATKKRETQKTQRTET
jgi:hypothetical protein